MSSRMKFSMTAVALWFAGAVAAPAVAQTPVATPSRIRGEIVSMTGDTMTVHRANADNVTIAVKPQVTVAAFKNVKLADIKPGSYVGITSSPAADGKLTASEVHVFPETARGTGEGHRAWDLSPQSTMTNGNVDTVVQGTSGRDLTVSYKGGNKTMTVPESTPVVTYISAAHADLVAGRKVFVIATPVKAGEYTAQRIVVEKDGVAPPM